MRSSGVILNYWMNLEEAATKKKEVAAKKNARHQRWRASHPEKVKELQKRNGKATKDKRRTAYNALKESFGCLNPACQWNGEYVACLLDFHHIEKEAKAGCVSQMIDTPDKMKQEIGKCTLLRANCHRLVTYGELDDRHLPRCEV